MRCYQCGGTYEERTDRLTVIDPFVGPISVAGLPYRKCDTCGDLLYPMEIWKALDDATDRRMTELLQQRPLGDFMTAAETADALGISRQALHKHRRIRHGFIHQTKFGGSTVYLRPSVEQFKKTGDGRFPLYNSEDSPRPLRAKKPTRDLVGSVSETKARYRARKQRNEGAP